jgi:hypothetical protein
MLTLTGTQYRWVFEQEFVVPANEQKDVYNRLRDAADALNEMENDHFLVTVHGGDTEILVSYVVEAANKQEAHLISYALGVYLGFPMEYLRTVVLLSKTEIQR